MLIFIVVRKSIFLEAAVAWLGVIAMFAEAESWLAPTHIQSIDNDRFALMCRNAGQVRFYDANEFKLTQTIDLGATPVNSCINNSGKILYVATEQPDQIVKIDLEQGKILTKVATFSGACSPVFDSDSNSLFLCNRWANKVTALDADTLDLKWAVPAIREPGSVILDPVRKVLYVANCQPLAKATDEVINTYIQLLNPADGKQVKKIKMPTHCADHKEMVLSPDGRTIAFVHDFAKTYQPSFQIEWAWINSSYVTFIDTETQAIRYTVALDDVVHGAASPFAIDWTPNGETLLVTHTGTHELSVINYAGIDTQLSYQGKMSFYVDVQEVMKPIRQRVPLSGKGPRNFILLGDKVIVPGLYTDTLSVVDLANHNQVQSIELNPDYGLTQAQAGEMYFNDASRCFQNWQSCTGCHPDARADSFNWDLMNDGLGNPKNTKSLLFSHVTPPSMCSGVRPTAESAVRAGVHHILFTQVIEEEALAMDEYLKSLRPLPSPYLVDGKLSEKAEKGREIFRSKEVGCSSCHSGNFFTDMQMHDVGTACEMDAPQVEFDTPTLREVWRTAPYLHDGTAVTILDLLTTGNEKQLHGNTKSLSHEDLEALAEYVLSL